jgi:hypothetical protein
MSSTHLTPQSSTMLSARVSQILSANEYPATGFRVNVVHTIYSEFDGIHEVVNSNMEVMQEATDEMRIQMKQWKIDREYVREAKLPKIVMVEFQENRDQPIIGNMYPPAGEFSQRGMVLNLDSGEVLNPGVSFINNVDEETFLTISSDPALDSVVQKPIEGASVTLFMDEGIVYISTNRLCLKFSRVLDMKGSRWNFYGSSSEETHSDTIIADKSRNSNIHAMALDVFVRIAMEKNDVDLGSCTDLPNTLENLVKKTFFESNPRLLVNGIVSYRSFASQSRSMCEEDQMDITFTPSAICTRFFSEGSPVTAWEMVHEEELWDLFETFALDRSKFEIDCTPSEHIRRAIESNPGVNPLLLPIEDFLMVCAPERNGRRKMFRCMSQQSVFRHSVIFGSPAEHERIRELIPKHRNRKFAEPVNIRERVHQIVSLVTKSTQDYSFDSIQVLGSKEAIALGRGINLALAFANINNDHYSETLAHWRDIAFPIGEYWVRSEETREQDLSGYCADSQERRRMFINRTDRRLCNALALLYTCCSETLRTPLVNAVSEIYVWRLKTAYLAFLPPRVFEEFENRYIKENPLLTSDKLPVAIHKMRCLRQGIPPNLSHSARKYKIADMVSHSSFMDLSFTKSVYDGK